MKLNEELSFHRAANRLLAQAPPPEEIDPQVPNFRQRSILVVGAVILIAALFFPPTSEFWDGGPHSLEFVSIFHIARAANPLNTDFLLAELFVISAVVASLYLFSAPARRR